MKSAPSELKKFAAENNLHDRLLIIEELLNDWVSEKRRAHIYRVAEYGLQLCEKSASCDTKAAKQVFIAALLHDLTKEKDQNFHKDWLSRYPELIEPDIYPAPVLHSKSAAIITRTWLKIEDPVIFEAIAAHTTGFANMSEAAHIVFAADMLGSMKKKKAEELIEMPLYDLCRKKIKYSIQKLVDQNRRVHEHSIRFYNSLCQSS